MSDVSRSDLRAANMAPLVDEHMDTNESEDDDDSSGWRTVHSDDEDELYDENDVIFYENFMLYCKLIGHICTICIQFQINYLAVL